MTVVFAPSSDADLFADDILVDPYPAYEALRDQGPAVYLRRYDCWAVGRYADVRTVLRDHERFSSVDSVGYEPTLNVARRGTVIASDPPEHDVLRRVLSEKLAPRALGRAKEDIAARAEELVDDLVGRGSFDAVADLARVFPLTIVADLLGMPISARNEVLRFADASFNTFGPLNDRTRRALPVAEGLFDALTSMMTRDKLIPGGWGEAVYAAADRGLIRSDQVIPLLRSYLVASMDTTINAISNAVWLFAEHPAEWQTLRRDRDLLRSAFEEILRFEPPVQVFFRRVTTDVDVDGTRVPAGSRVAVLFGSANRDPRKWPDPDRFVVDRGPMDHVGFGYGVHGCAGQGLARVEAHVVLSALLDRVDTIRLTAPPRRHLNNVVRGFATIPISCSP
jgi:cytochrome P450